MATFDQYHQIDPNAVGSGGFPPMVLCFLLMIYCYAIRHFLLNRRALYVSFLARLCALCEAGKFKLGESGVGVYGGLVLTSLVSYLV